MTITDATVHIFNRFHTIIQCHQSKESPNDKKLDIHEMQYPETCKYNAPRMKVLVKLEEYRELPEFSIEDTD